MFSTAKTESTEKDKGGTFFSTLQSAVSQEIFSSHHFISVKTSAVASLFGMWPKVLYDSKCEPTESNRTNLQLMKVEIDI